MALWDCNREKRLFSAFYSTFPPEKTYAGPGMESGYHQIASQQNIHTPRCFWMIAQVGRWIESGFFKYQTEQCKYQPDIMKTWRTTLLTWKNNKNWSLWARPTMLVVLLRYRIRTMSFYNAVSRWPNGDEVELRSRGLLCTCGTSRVLISTGRLHTLQWTSQPCAWCCM